MNENEKQSKLTVDDIDRGPEVDASRMSRSDSIRPYKDAVKEALEREYQEFLYSQSMGSWKRWAYVTHLEKELSLTEEQARAVQEEAVEDLRKSADPSDCDIFLNGTPEQCKALQDAIAREMYGDDPYSETPEQSSDSTATCANEGYAASQHEAELREARVLRVLDKAGVNGPTGWSPEALVQALREEGVDAEWQSPQDGRIGGIFIFRPGKRERSKNYIQSLLGPTDGGKEQS
jgi:hypothetical protein